MQLDIIVVLLRQAFLGHFSQTGIWQPRTLSLVKTPKAEVKQTLGEYLNWFKREPTENAGPTRRTLLPSGDERGLYADCLCVEARMWAVGVVDMWVYGERCQNETFLSEGPVQ